jgi:hypothetical protein
VSAERSWHAGLWIPLLALTLLGAHACGGDKGAENKSGEKKAGEAPAAVATADAGISGTITLAPSVRDKAGKSPLLMILASPSSDPNRPAIIVKRVPDATFPYAYRLTAEDITLVGSTLEGKLYVTARIDSAGRVGAPKPGTLEGAFPGNPVPVGSSKVDIVIDKAY